MVLGCYPSTTAYCWFSSYLDRILCWFLLCLTLRTMVFCFFLSLQFKCYFYVDDFQVFVSLYQIFSLNCMFIYPVCIFISLPGFPVGISDLDFLFTTASTCSFPVLVINIAVYLAVQSKTSVSHSLIILFLYSFTLTQ